MLALFIFQLATSLHRDFIFHQDLTFQCFNLAHQIGQKILYTFYIHSIYKLEKSQLNRTIFTDINLQGHQSGLGKSIKLLPSDASSQGPGIDFPI